MGNIESVDGQSEMKHHIMPLKVPMPDPTELEERFAIVLVSMRSKYTVYSVFLLYKYKLLLTRLIYLLNIKFFTYVRSSNVSLYLHEIIILYSS